MWKKVCLLLSAFVVVKCSPIQDESALRNVVGSFVNCMSSDLSLCLKEHALKAADRLNNVRQLKLSDSFTLINHGEKQARSLNPLPTDVEARRKEVSQRLWESTSDLLQNSEIEFSYGPDEESRGLTEESRGKKKDVKKKLKMLLPLAILAKIKAGALAILFLGVIALSVFKIAAILKVAFLVKALEAIKTLLQKKSHDDHGWSSSPPHHDHHDDHGYDAHASWSRSRNEAQNLAYAAYKK